MKPAALKSAVLHRPARRSLTSLYIIHFTLLKKSLLGILPQCIGPQVALFVEEAVGGAEHAELGAAIEGIANFLLFGRKCQDVRQGKSVG